MSVAAAAVVVGALSSHASVAASAASAAPPSLISPPLLSPSGLSRGIALRALPLSALALALVRVEGVRAEPPPISTAAPDRGASAAPRRGASKLSIGPKGGYRREELKALISRVPTFVVSNRESAPYLTQVDASGRRSGSFHLSPSEALKELQEVRAFDPAASLAVVPLDDIWFELPQTQEAAAASLAATPQPRSGTSSDLRLFSLAPLPDEDPSPLSRGSVPLFYASALLLEVEGAPCRPYYFRRADLQQTLASTEGASATTDVQAVALPVLMKLLSSGGLAGQPPPIFVAASEAVAVVDRLSASAATSPRPADKPQVPEDVVERLAARIPFGGGATRSKAFGLF